MTVRAPARVLAALALACTTLLTACDLAAVREWNTTSDVCTPRPGHPCMPPPRP
jgi:hypothetical protein